jgi:uncharacterized protein YndB with AHSA1/START domain
MLADTTDQEQYAALSFEFDLPHAPAKVWRALTEPDLLAEWLLPVIDLKLERGAAFTLKTQAHGDWDGTVNCRVREVDPPRRISYDWVVGDLVTVVTFTLTPSATGTRLHLVQSGFTPPQRKNFGGARYGWNMMGGKLIDLLGRMS